VLNSYFYSKTTKLYVARKPLEIDSRIKHAALKKNLSLDWDDTGRINFINFDDAKILLETLGGQMMSPVEYWQVLKDAQEEDDANMVEELMSNKYCEWLDRIYLRDGTHIDHPKVLSNYMYSGKRLESEYPHGRPGWFKPESNIN